MIRFGSVELSIYAFHPLTENSTTSTPSSNFISTKMTIPTVDDTNSTSTIFCLVIPTRGIANYLEEDLV